jgi:tetratricopeptide (TPR) repeat protein
MPTPSAPNPNVFEPPSAEQLARHLAQHPAAQTAAWQQRGPLLMVIAVAGLALLMIGQPGFALLPLFGLLGIMAYLSGQARTAAELQARAVRAWELAMIRRYRESLGQAWELLPACRTRPELHGRAITVIAHVLGELGRNEAAEVAYTYLLDRLHPDHPLALRLRLQQAMAALSSDRLADGDDILRKLRGQAEASKDESLTAAFRLARLIQDVHTGHYADAVEAAEKTAAALVPLGTEAGYGYALLALCFAMLIEHDPSVEDDQKEVLQQQAKRYWDKATLLIPPAALVYRYPELDKLSSQNED